MSNRVTIARQKLRWLKFDLRKNAEYLTRAYQRDDAAAIERINEEMVRLKWFVKEQQRFLATRGL